MTIGRQWDIIAMDFALEVKRLELESIKLKYHQFQADVVEFFGD